MPWQTPAPEAREAATESPAPPAAGGEASTPAMPEAREAGTARPRRARSVSEGSVSQAPVPPAAGGEAAPAGEQTADAEPAEGGDVPEEGA